MSETTTATSAHRRIRRNSKEIQRMFDEAKACKSFTLENQFRGAEFSLERLREITQPNFENNSRAYITECRGVYTIHFHSNHWVEVTL